MQKFFFLIILPLFIFSSCEKKQDYRHPKEVTIAGKVLNFDHENNDIYLDINRLGFPTDHENSILDSLGNFCARFKTYIPTDVWIRYSSNFLILVHPGDSIYVEFEGNTDQRVEILKTIKFRGSGAKTNQDAAAFQCMYFSNPTANDRNAMQKARKSLEVKEYTNFLDNQKRQIEKVYENFVTQVSPNQETKLWASIFCDQDYYDALQAYPMEHQHENRLNTSEWDVLTSYYDALLNRLPITEKMFIGGYSLSRYVNRFHYGYVWKHFLDNKLINKYRTKKGIIDAPKEFMDSLYVYGAIKYTSDVLLRQMVLTEIFNEFIQSKRIDFCEKYNNILNQYIREPYLKEPLLQLIHKLKDECDHPKISSDALLKVVANSSAKQLMDSILNFNRGKVIYLDCWATWCAPCREEMPNSMELMKQMKGKDIAFVFLCINSEEVAWKATLDELKIGGQHYFLSKEQSKDIRNAFGIEGIPFYSLIDKRGMIVEKGGSHLRAIVAKEKIEKLLMK
jgi:thiol-disulfide isomerase/thioredoxin